MNNKHKSIFNISPERVSKIEEFMDGRVVVITTNGMKIKAFKEQFPRYSEYLLAIKNIAND